MTDLSLYVVPERAGTLGSYVKFGEGVAGHTVVREALGVVTYHRDDHGVATQMLAMEAIPGMEEIQKAGEDILLLLLQTDAHLDRQDAQLVRDRLFEGRKVDAAV